jgi:hypothetical protein
MEEGSGGTWPGAAAADVQEARAVLAGLDG